MKDIIWDKDGSCSDCVLTTYICHKIVGDCVDSGCYKFKYKRRPCKNAKEAVDFIDTEFLYQSKNKGYRAKYIIVGITNKSFNCRDMRGVYSNRYLTFKTVFKSDNKIGVEE